MPDRPESLAAALAELQQHLPRITKSASAQYGKYADLAAVSAALLPELGSLGLAFTAKPTLMAMGEEIKFVLHYELRFCGSGSHLGEKLEGDYPLGTGNPQQLGSAITYARRYCLLAVTGAAPDDGSDDDGQAASAFPARFPAGWPGDSSGREVEVNADGSITRAEMERMRRGPDPAAWRATGTAENDPWYDPGPARPDHLAPAEESPGSVQRSQWTLMRRAMPGTDWNDADAVRAEMERRLGRPVPTRGALSYMDAKKIIEWKEPAGASEAPV